MARNWWKFWKKKEDVAKERWYDAYEVDPLTEKKGSFVGKIIEPIVEKKEEIKIEPPTPEIIITTEQQKPKIDEIIPKRTEPIEIIPPKKKGMPKGGWPKK